MPHRRLASASAPAAPGTGDQNRREFLKGAASAAAGLLAAPLAKSQRSSVLPTVALGPHRVTRLIAGGNPLFGYSHFSWLLDRPMREYFTDKQVVQFMLDCEKAGINTWQSNYPKPLERQLPLIRQAGCKLQWIALADTGDVGGYSQAADAIMAAARKCVVRAAKEKPMAIAIRGIETDQLWKDGKVGLLRDFINQVHDLGLPAGVSAHNPAAIEALESKGWPIDFYMTCFYRVTRSPEEFQKEIGVVPVGETYLGTDAERMGRVIRQAKPPCLGFKILAAGRKCESPGQVREAFEFAFKNIKPTDATIVGMFPRFSDQISENTRIVREIAA